MTFLGETEHFSRKNEALMWSILVGKQKHNVQKPRYVPLNMVWFSYSFTITRLEQGVFLDHKPFKECEDLRSVAYISQYQ